MYEFLRRKLDVVLDEDELDFVDGSDERVMIMLQIKILEKLAKIDRNTF